MNRIWANRLEAGDRKWAEVPVNRKNDVAEILKRDVVNEVITQGRYTEITGEPYIV